jgi:hypothetical protein
MVDLLVEAIEHHVDSLVLLQHVNLPLSDHSCRIKLYSIYAIETQIEK